MGLKQAQLTAIGVIIVAAIGFYWFLTRQRGSLHRNRVLIENRTDHINRIGRLYYIRPIFNRNNIANLSLHSYIRLLVSFKFKEAGTLSA
jgi:hypothetical protein